MMGRPPYVLDADGKEKGTSSEPGEQSNFRILLMVVLQYKLIQVVQVIQVSPLAYWLFPYGRRTDIGKLLKKCGLYITRVICITTVV